MNDAAERAAKRIDEECTEVEVGRDRCIPPSTTYGVYCDKERAAKIIREEYAKDGLEAKLREKIDEWKGEAKEYPNSIAGNLLNNCAMISKSYWRGNDG